MGEGVYETPLGVSRTPALGFLRVCVRYPFPKNESTVIGKRFLGDIKHTVDVNMLRL
jgi:hypothetical protein